MRLLKDRYTQFAAPSLFQSKNPVIEATGLGVKYLDGSKRDDLQSLSYDFLFKKRNKSNDVWALQDITFKGYPGDILGIIGSNGAGKTTLCKVISGLLRPDVGNLKVEGEVSTLFSLGIGFNQQLSGRENVFLNGMMLGIPRKYIESMLPQIIDFSGLHKFINQPLKYYSSGMKARLGFSIAAMVEPEILILDEALNAGDLEFNDKAAKKMQEIVKKAKMVMVVTHQLDFVQKYCTRVLWIDKGIIRADGNPQEVVSLYKASIPVVTKKKKKPVELIETKTQIGTSKVLSIHDLGVCFSLREHSSKKDRDEIKSKVIKHKPFWALNQVSFSVYEGEIIGIIGPNGAGKSTLCKVLTGILKPDRGSIAVRGQTTALLSLGTGFNHQLTGKDNIFLNGMMLGIQKKELYRVYNKIVEFSGLGQSINKPIKQYSSGMRARLGFSIAAMVKPDLFIIDEALSVGDQAFYEKASAKIQELIGKAKAVIVVTHSMDFVEKVCTRAIWLEKGSLKFSGHPKEIVARYQQTLKKE